MRQKVINYEFQTVQLKRKQQSQLNHGRRNGECNGEWRLQQKISRIPDFDTFQVRLVGYQANAHIVGMFYCLVFGCLCKSTPRSELFLKLKYQLYSLCEEFLTETDQKIFVEGMCLLQYSKNVLEFVSRASYLLKLIKVIVASYVEGVALSQVPTWKQLELFLGLFEFVHCQRKQQSVFQMSVAYTKFYIIEEKQIWFVLLPNSLKFTRNERKLMKKKSQLQTQKLPKSPQTNGRCQFLFQNIQKNQQKSLEFNSNKTFLTKSIFDNHQRQESSHNLRDGFPFQSLSHGGQKKKDRYRVPEFILQKSQRK